MLKWIDQFDERQQKEIQLSILYAAEFNHGTDGHNAKLIIAKMALLLDSAEEFLEATHMMDDEDAIEEPL